MNYRLLRSILSLETDDVFDYVTKTVGKPAQTGKLWHYWPGDVPLAMVAHIDTVHQDRGRTSEGPPDPVVMDVHSGIAWAPNGLGADDRAGVYAIVELWRRGHRPHIILTDLEESGCVGAKACAKEMDAKPLADVRALIQIDRRNRNDCVYYDYSGQPLRDYVQKYGFKEAQGSFSDISVLAPAFELAAVNLSAGYYNEHTHEERLHLAELAHTVDRVGAMLRKPPKERIKWEEKPASIYQYDGAAYGYLRKRREQQQKTLGLGFATDGKLGDLTADDFLDDDYLLWREEFDRYASRDDAPPERGNKGQSFDLDFPT